MDNTQKTSAPLSTLSEKILICPAPASEENGRSDQRRILDALKEKGFENLHMQLPVIRKLYPMCREADTDFTVSLVHTEDSTEIVDIEKGDTRSSHYGIAVDYGSTTIVFQLVDLNSGESVYECRETNGQRAYGTDILTRIIYGLDGEEHKKDLHNVTVDTFHQGFLNILSHTGIDPASCPAMVISGNTTMIHFLLGLDAWTVFSAPYSPVTTDPGFFTGKELDLEFSGMVYIVPSASNYIGGDIVSGLLTIDLQKQSEVCAFFDVGTNGELVMGNQDWLIAGAGAAGPALEGYISKYGMIANPGAIDRVKIDGPKLTFTTIEDQKPVGICGSGIIDLLAGMRLNGWVDITGTLNPKASPRIILIEGNEAENTESEYVAVYAWAEESASGENLYFSQTDITQYIETKAAAHTMVDCLLDSAGITENEISRMFLSGAFCNHADLESAITIGMFPDLDREKFVPLRNSSLEGAKTLLLHREKFEDIRTLLEMIYCVQFASMPDFMLRMMAAKFIPHTNMDQYPSVQKKLAERGQS